MHLFGRNNEHGMQAIVLYDRNRRIKQELTACLLKNEPATYK